MRDKFIKAVAVTVVSIVSAALVAYLKDPENREYLKVKALQAQKRAKKYVNKQAKLVQYKLS
jgi:hypothetical protein